MNAIEKMFAQKQKKVLSIYFTAGFPQLGDTVTILKSLVSHGADMIEVGMPYSDPLADGPVIQNSSMVALQNGMTLAVLFEQLQAFKKSAAASGDVPLVLMGYLNPVLQYGIERFCADAKEAGISGVILPDLPLTEYENAYKKVFDQYGLHFIFLITPETSEERIRKMDRLSTGFIYAVSSSSITGSNADIHAQQAYFRRIELMRLTNPVLIGFGIRDHATFDVASAHAAGAIIGTAYIKVLENASDIHAATRDFLNGILQP